MGYLLWKYSFAVNVKVEMDLKLVEMEFGEELKNSSSPAYKELAAELVSEVLLSKFIVGEAYKVMLTRLSYWMLMCQVMGPELRNLLRISNFPYGLTRNVTSHSVKNLAFHSDGR